MGGCDSRVQEEDMKGHMVEKASKNDHYFSYTPFYSVLVEDLKSELNLQHLEKKIELFKKARADLVCKLESAACGVAVAPELNFELRKGANLVDSSFTLFTNKIYAKVSLEPKGPKLRTKLANKSFPVFSFFNQYKDFTKYKYLLVKIKEIGSVFGDTLLGTHEINLDLLRDQKVRDGWFDLKSQIKSNPCIFIRVQYLYNEKALIEDMIKEVEDKIQALQKVIDDIYYERYMSD